MIVFSTEAHDPALVVELDGELEPGCPELLVGHLAALAGRRPLVVELTHLVSGDGPEGTELLLRLGSTVFDGGIALVHQELGARRSLRARTALPVLPTVDEALSGHALTSLGVGPEPRGADR